MIDDDFPTVGLTEFDLWMTKLYLHMFKEKFLDIEYFGCLDREYWQQYYDNGDAPKQAFDVEIPPVEINIERMEQALSGESTTMPRGLNLEEMREFILRSAG